MKTINWAIIGALIVAGSAALYLTNGDEDAQSSAGAGGSQTKAPGRSAGPAPGGRRSGGRPAPLVVISEVENQLINDRLKAVGNGTAVSSVSVVPLSGGILTQIMVSPGQQVEVDSTLATLDDEEQQIAYDRAAREASEAQSDANRLEQLYRSRTVTRVERDRARAALTDAQLALRETQLKLARRTIAAPISGIVGFVSVDPGNYINAQTELVTIDDRSKLAVEFWVPERFANAIALGQSVQATALADPGVQYEGQISGIGSRIESDSRTLPVKAIIDNANDTLRPGMSFELQLVFPGQRYPAVNPLAIQWDSNGSYVWQVVDDKVQRVAARIIQRNPTSVLVEAKLMPGDQIVSEGLLALRPGATVRVQGAPPAGAPRQRPGGEAPAQTGEGGPPKAAARAAASDGASGS